MAIIIGMDVFDRKFPMKRVNYTKDGVTLTDERFNITDALPHIMEGLAMSMLKLISTYLGVLKLFSLLFLVFKSDMAKALQENSKKLREFCREIVKERR